MVQLTNEFSVYWWDPNGTYHLERRGLGAKEAVEFAFEFTNRPAAKLGMVKRVMITDGGDCCVFDWNSDQGVIWPKQEDLREAGVKQQEQ